MRYRPEIDGLRAVAVVPVVLFHAGAAAMPGGFLGVDVFFVISGYLITAILWAEMAGGDFSLWRFYERRARRLLPALFTVLAVTTVCAWILLAPADLARYGRSLLAIVGLSSNMLFWLEAGYFDTASELKPLLHTWSLAVEEQFYLFFPLILMLGLFLGPKLGRQALLALVVQLAVASFAFAIMMQGRDPDGAFYLLPTRAWELLAGAAVALALHGRGLPRFSQGAEALSLFGFCLVIGAMLGLDASIPTPGPSTLIPVLGTVLIIAFGVPGTMVAALLSLRGIVQIGLISYSTYLWHHPLFAFARYELGHDPGVWSMIGLTVLAFGLGWLTWVLIETPLRRRRWSRVWQDGWAVTEVSVSGAMVVTFIGAVAVHSGGFFRPMPETYRTVMSEVALTGPKIDLAAAYGQPGHVGVALLGDSHGMSLAAPLGQALADRGLRLDVLAKAGCPPVRGLLRHDLGPLLPSPCHGWNQRAYREVLTNPQIETVVMASRLTLYLESARFDNGEGGHEMGATRRVVFDGLDQAGRIRDDAARRDAIARRYRDEIEGLLAAGKQVILVYPVPEVGWDVAAESWKRRFGTGGITISTSAEVFAARNQRAYDLLDGIAARPNLTRVRPADRLCNTMIPGRCAVVWQNVAYYRDNNHLSHAGVGLVLPDLLQAITQGLEPDRLFRVAAEGAAVSVEF